MPEPRPPRAPVVLRAALTLDGKLDGAPQLLRGTQSETLDTARCRELLATGAVDELHLTVRTRIDGRRDAPTLSGPPTPDFFRLRRLPPVAYGNPRRRMLLQYRVRRRARRTPPPG